MVRPIIKLFLFQILRLLKTQSAVTTFLKRGRSSIRSWFYTSACPNQTRSYLCLTLWYYKNIIFLCCLPPVKLYFRPDHSDLAEPSSFHIRQVSAGGELFQVIPKYDKPLCNGSLICVWIDSRQVIAGGELFWIIQNFVSWENFNVTGLQIIL